MSSLRTVMSADGLPEAVILRTERALERLASGDAGTIAEAVISPVEELPRFDDLPGDAPAPLDRLVVIKLNGGLGTSMGLSAPKSLLPVKDGKSFLDLACEQILWYRQAKGARIPLLLMNSAVTVEATEEALAAHREIEIGLPTGFMQHRVPKIDAATLAPVSWPADPSLEWCPPGHGDLYLALETSGALTQLLEAGYRWAFVSNIDNLGAVVCERILAHFVASGAPLLMEVADRTGADRKGGHLCHLADGRLALREIAQCPQDDLESFQDIERHRYFNTNSIWLDLEAVKVALGDGLDLDPIFNRKTVDPRDPASTPVVQLESAMGSAIAAFKGAAALAVPRSRFSPVKTTDDLLAVRSDAYELGDDGRLSLVAATTPVVKLDKSFYKLVDDFDARFPAGPPSLFACRLLDISGDVTFSSAPRIAGALRLEAAAASSLEVDELVGTDDAAAPRRIVLK